MKTCERVQGLLAEGGAAALRHDAEAQEHLVSCSACFGLLEALAAVDEALGSLPVHDASQALVDVVLAAVARTPAGTEPASVAAPQAAKPRGRMVAALLWVLAGAPRRLLRLVAAPWVFAWRRARRAAAWIWAGRARWTRLKILLPAGATAGLLFVVTASLWLTQGSPSYDEVYAEAGLVPMPDPSSADGAGAPAAPPPEVGEQQPTVLGKMGRGAGGVLSFGDDNVSGDLDRAQLAKPKRKREAKRDEQVDNDKKDVAKNQAAFEALFGTGGEDAEKQPAARPEVAGPAKSLLSALVGDSKDSPSGSLSTVLGTAGAGGIGGLGLRGTGPGGGGGGVGSGVGLGAGVGRLAAGGKEAPPSLHDDTLVQELVGNLAETSTQARIVPSFKSGKAHGFKLFGVKPGSAYDRLGLKNGDVIEKVDGEPLSSPDKALAVFQRAQNQRSVTIEGWRGERPLSLTYEAGGTAALQVGEQVSSEGTAEARELLAERARTQDLRFKEAGGYWANTYVPGDSTMRLLQARLADVHRKELLGGAFRLDDAAREYAAPLDAPENAALGISVQADQRALSGEARLLVAVGLKGTPRLSGSRPAMTLAVVLDLSQPLTPESGAALRALLTSLARRKSTGDRFSLVVAGRVLPGSRQGLLVDGDSFRHGALMVGLNEALAAPEGGLSLTEAMQRAQDMVLATDDPTQPLGTSSLLLVTPGQLGGQLPALVSLAHAAAVGGVSTSVVALGGGADAGEIERIVLAGQGNQRLLSSADEAQGVVDRELAAVARVVARAVRLRIRLAPGVKLVDVIGSHRLDEVRAEEVRQAEKSIDRRLAKNLGLASDRGEDEEGIQIVIPAYYAGDAHVVLLDVVVPGPGPVADVRVRFKDLVYLENGVGTATLNLPRGREVQGPIQLAVQRRYLGHQVSRALRAAGEAIAAGDMTTAATTLESTTRLLAGMRVLLPGLASDQGLLADLRMLGEYQGLLPRLASDVQRDHIADSLRFASYLKILPRPRND